MPARLQDGRGSDEVEVPLLVPAVVARVANDVVSSSARIASAVNTETSLVSNASRRITLPNEVV